MINTYCYDVEVLPNFFSITFINLNSYLQEFKDACQINAKGKKKPIPLVQKYTVAEIKDKLNDVSRKKFYITDTNDIQLLPMLSYINNFRPHYDEYNTPIRSDLFGYNSSKYDKLMVAALLMFANQTNNTKELIKKLYETSKTIIDLQNNPEVAKTDYFLNTLNKYSIPYTDVDVMTIFALNKVGKGEDKNGNTIYFGKSLKQTSINLQWYEILEHQLPDISEKDIHFYEKDARYSGLTPDKVNILVNRWDRYILDEWIDEMMRYNENDVFIVCEMIRLFIDEVRLRYNISKVYGINVLSSSRSNIADKMFIKFYSEFSGLTESQWRGKKTERTALAFKRVIFPFIKFKTKECQELLDEMKQVVIYSIGKKALKDIADKYPNFKYLKTNNDNGWFEIKINNLIYTIATGGLHSQDIPGELRSKLKFVDGHHSTGEDAKEDTSIWDNITDDSYIYTHADVNSFYPSIMSVYKVAPPHINQGVFVKLITWLKETRVQAKHSKEDIIDGIPKDVLAQVLKIVINSIYGKLGYSYGDIYDRLAVLKVTINGQLLLLKLCEELELNGIEVMSANTDGIVVKVYKNKKEIYDKILNDWQNETKLSLDSEEYKAYITRDINNYCIEEINGKISYKGALNPYMYLTDLQKGYDMPIVAKAASEFLLHNKPIMETLYEATNILDFCKTQNISRKFHIEYSENGRRVKLQNNTRFYVVNVGGTIEKVENTTNKRSNLCAGYKVKVINTLTDERIAYRNICYTYYYKEVLKIVDPIKLGISIRQKGDVKAGLKSGKVILKKMSGNYNNLFDDVDE